MPVPSAIRAEGLGKRYGAVDALAGLELDVAPGERMGLLGPNGAGKTTAIRLMLGMLRPTSGRVAIAGYDLATERRSALGEVGYLPGELGLIREISGAHQLRAFARLHPRPPTEQRALLSRFELGPGDLARPVRQYSRGMKQKLGLVAALQHDPPVIILDEPTSGLDPVMQARLIELLDERARAGRTVLFSSHVLAEVEELCDRVAMVRAGRLIVVESVSKLRSERVRSVAITFRAPVEPAAYAVPEISAVHVAGRVHEFALSGDPSPLLGRLASLPVEDIAIETARLEDVFRERYGEGTA